MNRLRQRRLAIRQLLHTRAIAAAAAVVALLAVLPTPAAFGSGEERTSVAEDLTIRTDSRWAGGAEGGYLPIRVQVANHGTPRDLTFEFEPVADGKGVRTRRVIGVEQNATMHFTLSVPLVDSRDGRLHVYEGSRPLAAHSRSISVPSAVAISPSPPAMLVISPSTVDCGRYVAAANSIFVRRRPELDFIRADGRRSTRRFWRPSCSRRCCPIRGSTTAVSIT